VIEEARLPDGGYVAKVCGDGGIYGLGFERNTRAEPVYSKGCTEVRGQLRVEFDLDLSPYESVEVVEGSLFLGYLVDLTDLSAFSRLQRVGGLRVERLAKLRSLSGLEGLRSIGDQGLVFTDNAKLESLSSLRACSIGAGPLAIKRNDSLRTLDGLQGITRVSELSIVYNPVLEDLSGLSGLRRIDGNVVFDRNLSLPRSEVVRFLSGIEVGGRVDVF
jgi:hypothetical protein